MSDNIFMPEGQHDTILIMAPGPSLSKEQVSIAMERNPFTIVIGDAWRMNPFAEILYHCDARWWNHYKGVPDFLGCQRVSMQSTNHNDVVKQIVRAQIRHGLELVKPQIVAGANSGYQAINLAVHYQPKKIVLLGYDMKKAEDGRYNIIGDHPKEIRGRSKFSTFIEYITELKEPLRKLGITVYNSTPDSALKCFGYRDLRDALRA